MIVHLKIGGGRATTWADLALSQPSSEESTSMVKFNTEIRRHGRPTDETRCISSGYENMKHTDTYTD